LVDFAGVWLLRFYDQAMIAEQEAFHQKLQRKPHVQDDAAHQIVPDSKSREGLLRSPRHRDLRPPSHARDDAMNGGSEELSASDGGHAQEARTDTKEILVLSTKLGDLKFVLRPDLSAGSVDYIHRLVESGACNRCNLYRAEKPGILQGVLANKDIPTNDVLGGCPAGLDDVKNDCPAWDKHCGCHGPIMTQGAVGWAAGTAGGPDFFIDNYKRPAKFWGTQHTNWAFIEDDESFRIINEIWTLPTTPQGGLTRLKAPIHFDLSIIRE